MTGKSGSLRNRRRQPVRAQRWKFAFTAAAFVGQPEFGNFSDAGAIAVALERAGGRAAGVMFALALIDAGMIGAAAVSLATAYAIGDVFSLNHSLHRPVGQAKGFYAVYVLLIVISAAIVLTPVRVPVLARSTPAAA